MSFGSKSSWGRRKPCFGRISAVADREVADLVLAEEAVAFVLERVFFSFLAKASILNRVNSLNYLTRFAIEYMNIHYQIE